MARITRNIEELEVETLSLADLPYPNLQPVIGQVAALDTKAQLVQLADGTSVAYDKASQSSAS